MPAEDALRAGESRALSSGEAPLYTGSGKPAPKLKAKGKRTRNTIIGLITTILLGGGAFLTMTGNTAIIGQFSSNAVQQVGNTNYGADVKRATYLVTDLIKNDANNFPDTLKKNLSANHIEIEGSTGFRWDGNTYPVDQLETLYRNDPKFRKAFSDSTKVRSSSFYSKTTNKLMQKWGISRNSLKDFKSTGDTEVDAKKYREIQEPHFDNNETLVGLTTDRGEVEVENEDGTKTKQHIYGMDDTSTSGKVDSTSSQVSEAAKSSARNYINSATRTISDASTSYCMGYRVANMISMVTSSLATYSAIKYALTIMESFSKTQIGEGSSSAINEVLNKLFENRTVTVTDYSKIDGINNGEDAGQVELTGAAIQDPGLASIISGAVISSSAGKYFSNANINNTALRAFGTNENRFTACAAIQAGAAAASLVSIAVTGGVAKVASTFIKDFIIGTAVNFTISAALSFAIPAIARLLYTNTFDTSVGMVMGAAIAMGLGATSYKLAQSTGSAFANRELNNRYQKETRAVLALDAEVDRLNRSPFDVSSQNTFLGSIVSSLIPLKVSGSVTPINTLTTITSKSLASLTGSVLADGEGSTFQTTYGDCPDADDNGMSGNLYCNVYTAHDTSTTRLSLFDTTYLSILKENGLEIDENGKQSIKPNSPLAWYISFVVNRESEPGMLDANIVNAIEEAKLGKLSVVGAAPGLGDIIDAIAAVIDMDPETVAWATGTVNSNDLNINPEWETKFKYLSQYVSDANVLSYFGDTNASVAIANYMEEYEKEHPVDNTRSGYIARISGITKQNAETILAIVDYYEYLNEYDLSSVIATEDQTTIKTSAAIIAESTTSSIVDSIPQTESYLASIAINPNKPIYTDIRNRSYAV